MKLARHPIAAALRAQAKALEVAADALEAEDASIASGDEYVNQHTSPLGKRRFLTAASRGDFPTFKTGKLVLAKRVDFDAWLSHSQRIAVSETDPVPVPPASDEDALRSKLGLRLVGARR